MITEVRVGGVHPPTTNSLNRSNSRLSGVGFPKLAFYDRISSLKNELVNKTSSFFAAVAVKGGDQ